jgi:7-cyano-7-deazaguanine tRNA-ribosyltransferase
MEKVLSFPKDRKVRYFPVVHLLTGPPGLTRNGGIWKEIKNSFKNIYSPPSFMVQALHFTNYTLSQGAWEDWGFDGSANKRLERELEKTFGSKRDIFMDSGGFQLLHSDKIDLSKWGMRLNREDILSFQLKFNPTRIASLDSPLPYNATPHQVAELQHISIDNAAWLLESTDRSANMPVPYLAVHGRNPDEIRHYLERFEARISPRSFKNGGYGIALGSQVPLTKLPSLIASNINTVLKWMDKNCDSDVPLHIFGIGDSIVGSILATSNSAREISYDNSTYAQAAYHLKVFDPATSSYIPWDPNHLPECSCYACAKLKSIGQNHLNEIMTAPPYRTHSLGNDMVNRSDIIALIALHNMQWWKFRISSAFNIPLSNTISYKPSNSVSTASRYSFPLRRFKARAPNLLVLPCSKTRPYSESPSHKKVKKYLSDKGFEEGIDYDRITLSGLYGPVHWKDETLPDILSYDFQLNNMISKTHLNQLSFTFGTVLNVIRKRYNNLIGFIRPRIYLETFGPVIYSFNGILVSSLQDIPPHLGK